jgi:acyl-CoA synthetase (AMP-forming)/AMP-acid ligase II
MRAMNLAERIREVLALDPAAGAVEFEGRWHSWGELASRARALDAALTAAQLGPGTTVGLLLRNTPELIGAVLGVVTSERCVVTLNPHQGDAKLAEDLRALRLPAIAGLAEDWGRPEVRAAAEGALGLVLARGSDARIEAVPGLEKPGPGPHRAPAPGIAIEMLTSGTTGAPKRVQLGYAALEQSLLGSGEHYEKRSGDARPRLREGVAIVNAPLVHVGGLWRTLQCIADGRPIALLERFRVEPWLDLVRRHKPRTVSLVPAALKMVLDADLDPADLASLKSVVSGTAPLPPEHADAFEAKYGIPVLTTYGATEFAGGVAGWSLADRREWGARKRGSVGRAHPGCELRVVDPQTGAARPPGAEGLLEVRSAQLGKGSDWVRTTDLAVLDADGFLYIRGRADSAIIRGGFKVLPAEVAAVLESHPAVREAAVVALPDPRLGQVPVAAVELREGHSLEAETLRAFARDHLAAYQVPAQIRIVASLPRTPSMKVSQPEVRELFEA